MSNVKSSAPTHESHNKIWDDLHDLHNTVANMVTVAAISTAKMVTEIAKLPVADKSLAVALGKDIKSLTQELTPLVDRINNNYNQHKELHGGTGNFEAMAEATTYAEEYQLIESDFTKLLPMLNELQENMVTYSESTLEKK